jgi:hypothetical protein
MQLVTHDSELVRGFIKDPGPGEIDQGTLDENMQEFAGE